MSIRSLAKIKSIVGVHVVAGIFGGLFFPFATHAVTVAGLESLTNQHRAANGLSSLIDDYRLNIAAANKASDMITNNYWAHTSPSGVSPLAWISGAGYPYTYAGENLARGMTSDASVINAWMNSVEHRGNILNANYRNIGCGSANGVLQGVNTVVTVCMFGATKATVAPTPVPTSAPVAATPVIAAPVAAAPVPSPIVTKLSISPAVALIAPTPAISLAPSPSTVAIAPNPAASLKTNTIHKKIQQTKVLDLKSLIQRINHVAGVVY